MGESTLGFGLLGPLVMTVESRSVPLGTPKQRAVMATLLINRNRVVGVESLINAAWNENPVPAARATIHTYVSNLRRLLVGAEAGPHAVLAAAPPGYRLSISDGQCDLDRFIAETTEGTHAAATGLFEQASSHLSTALAQWRGPVLDDLRDFDFVEVFATALVEDKVSAQTARAEIEIACGRAHTVIGELESLVAEHPYREPLWAQLITACYVSGRQSDALDAHRRLKRVLADGLGIDPSPMIGELHARILRQEPLDVKRAAKTTAIRAARSAITSHTVTARLYDAAGRLYLLGRAITRIGRLDDNDIILDDADVSRYHAAIIDTGAGFVITDLRSANGVEVQGRRLQSSAPLAHGDRVRICGHEFTFEVEPSQP